jgi:hypothetical protein
LPDLSNKKFDLMSGGEYNGPNRECACPAPLNPFHRKLLGWLDYNNISIDTIIQSTYNLRNSQLFKIKDSNIGANYFIIEYRRFDELMNLGNNIKSDYNSYISNLTYESGILVWRVFFNTVVGLIYADGIDDENYDGHIFPGNKNVKIISPWSDSRIPYDEHLWYPNTKPTINCGMEIISENAGHYIIKLFSINPLNASPSKPRDLSIYRNNIDEVILNWEENFEPDVINYGFYKIYKCASTDSNPTSFEYVTTISAYIGGIPVTSWTDTEANSGIPNNLFYRITVVDSTNKESVPSEYVWIRGINPAQFLNSSFEKSNEVYLFYNYPNPFNAMTTIKFQIVEPGFVTLNVYDLLGREIATLINEEKERGAYEITFDASNLSSGMYIYRIKVNNFEDVKKMMIMK